MSPADSPFAQLPAPGPHPATAELRAYAAGTLPPAEEHRLEAHLLDCERCAELVEGFAMTDAPTTDRAVAELRTRLQARLGTTAPEPVATQWAWPRIAAAAAMLAVVGGGIWGWQHQAVGPPAGTVRQEIIVSAPAAPAPPVAVAPQPKKLEPAATPAPAASAATDYAAVAPAAPRRPARLRTAPKPTAPAVRTDGFLASSAAKTAAVAARAQPASAPVVAAEAAADEQTAPPAASAGWAAAEEKAAPPDTAAASKAENMELGAPAKKAKSIVADVAAARVRNTPMATVAINPAPVGGTPAFRSYLRREAAEFEPEKGPSMNGSVYVKFTVGADGKVSDLKVTRGLRDDYDAEALRIVCDGPAWQPGIAGGRRAALPMEVIVPF
ncbi:zf-HC2 domain-containing protein [Hymenobacter armeniacus]|uniref:Energy transducer TonB n=1 Tax=Hymenobacter armeniacus TaxID=2771358 RepID=A0ABR8JY24_9BACT|nr:zf-HC2 domain-containing protein [Hymenobacter armeniacus]MBD2723482.1 energy transducer TonB [Hymenobacter armeniacus]